MDTTTIYHYLDDIVRVFMRNLRQLQDNIQKHISTVVAEAFAAALHQGLAYSKSAQTAFDFGRNELQLMGLTGDEDVPGLLTREGVDASAVALVV